MTTPPNYREQDAWHMRRVFVDIAPTFKPGSQPPTGYIEWHDWAGVQSRAGLKQRRCATCGLYRFPQEKCCPAHERKDPPHA